ncbi:cysteine hydrolase family protein [Klebsiella pneumoniae]|uniref:cysteine hydrolase family protein n=1 Tax=Enterobacteriaceae TaxID=543 RepID=UPI003970EB96
MLFPNFSLGEEYEHAPPATNRQISPYLPSGRFRTGLPVEGLAIERGDLFYACPRASVFYGTALDADLRTRGVSTLVMAGISTTGVVLSSVARASDADYDVRLVQTAATTRIGMPTKLCCVPGSADVYRSCNFRASHDRGHSRRWIGARQGQSKSGCGHRGACNSQKPIAVAEVL